MTDKKTTLNEKQVSKLLFWLEVGFVVGCLSVALSGCTTQRRCTVTLHDGETTSLMAYSYTVTDSGALFIGGSAFAPGTWEGVQCEGLRK